MELHLVCRRFTDVVDMFIERQTTVDRHTETLHTSSCADSCLSERHGLDPVLTPHINFAPVPSRIASDFSRSDKSFWANQE